MDGDSEPEIETPAQRLHAALELTDLTERMLVHRLRREGLTDAEARARLVAWREEPGTHAGDPWFTTRLVPFEP